MIYRLVNDICEAQLPPMRILGFERSGQFGTGVAFQTDMPHVILNRTGSNMSASSLNPAHFSEWLNQLGYPAGSESRYLPRQIFGHYLQSTLRSSIEKAAKHGHEVTLISKSIKSISRKNADYNVFDGENHWQAHHIVLCTGNLPQVNFRHLASQPQYLATPFPLYKLRETIDPDSAVGIIGSRLSAVDALINLAKSGHRGPITLLSRKGYLPSVQKTSSPWTLRYCTASRIADLRLAAGGTLSYRLVLRLVLKELSIACGKRFSASAQRPETGDAAELLRRDIRQASAHPQPWQAAFVALNAVIADLWNALSDADQRLFKQRDFSRFMALRVPIPLENALTVEQLLTSGQLRLFPNLKALLPSGNGFVATADNGQCTRFDVVVNCTGVDNDLSTTTDPLYRSMLNAGLLCAHPLGGVRVDFRTNQAMDDGDETHEQLFVVGNLTSGTHLFCSVLEVNTRHCAVISGQIVANAEMGALRPSAREEWAGKPALLAAGNA